MQRFSQPDRRCRWRLPLLCALLLLSGSCIVLLRATAPPIDRPMAAFVTLEFVSYLPYFAACLLVLATRPLAGRWRWIELAIILLGACVLRLIVLPLPPISHDPWRYLWDARITLHGYSPYIYYPRAPALVPLRNITFDNSRYRDVPTLYPPGAQAFYLLSYLIAPDNMLVLKGIFTGLDVVTCCALALLLRWSGLDPARCLIYAWCPLPIIEFALMGHQEAITLTFTMLACICALGTCRASRIVTGFLLAMATLVNFYPLLFLLVLLRSGDTASSALRGAPGIGPVRRLLAQICHLLKWLGRLMCRDWALLTTFVLTLSLAYLPYLILGHGSAFGFLTTYTSEQLPNAGSVLLTIRWLGAQFGLNKTVTLILGNAVDLLVVGGVALAIAWLRSYARINMASALLLLTGTVFAVSTHIYPWYTTALLPWLALMIGPLWTRQGGLRARAPAGRALAAGIIWYFACGSITWYIFFFLTPPPWTIYYLLVYDVTLAGLVVAALLSVMQMRTIRQVRCL